ncbi:Cadmium, zinc and cobalt-transporting ATPase [Symmachiella macrocystis]|uniref:P-type Zn(2+) transporter n=1 Tax=Symmachiella macrocystis TaxID=2527985 RepID=A0A5C6BI70_9PLAN|nr:cation-translocating P-type ATPase [Symmachiella macrocystis]TWU11725.1 Cadmium, zinc and cobalt-transporting ATPase [Symmachiella macrocystis]
MSTVSTPVARRIQEDLDAGMTRGERIRLGLRIGTAMAAGVLLASATAVDSLFPIEQRPISECLKAAAAILVLLPILREAAQGLLTGSTDAYSAQLVAIASLAALAIGDFVTAAIIPIILSVAFFLEERSVLGAQAAIEGLKSLQARKARRVDGQGVEHEVDTEDLLPGDLIVIRPGETIPADGEVAEGYSAIDQSTITGESTPQDVGPGAKLFAGTVNHNGLLQVTVSSAGDNSTLGKILELLHEAEQSKTEVLRLIEDYAKYFVLGVLLIAGISLFLSRDVSRAIAVLVVGCPGPFILAGPAAMVAALAAATRKGILIKNAKFLETLTEVDAVIFDKTGTVTLGQLKVLSVATHDSTESELLEAAATCANVSQHPVSRAIITFAQAKDVPAMSNQIKAQEMPGRGVIVDTEQGQLLLGRRAWIGESGFDLPDEPEHAGPIVWVATRNESQTRCLGAILLADQAREDAKQVIEDLRQMGVMRTTLLTGDRLAVAEKIAADVGLDHVVAEVLPGHKREIVQAERQAGYQVMVVGDGVNDAPALAGSDIGVAMGASGAEIALRSADVVLMTERLDRLTYAIDLARRTRRTIHRNVIVGVGLTVVMLALASTGVISPIAGAVLQNIGELFVIGNSAALLRDRQLQASNEARRMP